MQFGRENVFSVYMPNRLNKQDEEHAKLVADAFKVEHITVPLNTCFDELVENTKNNLKSELSKEALINIMPRLRMTTLYAIAQTKGYLVCGTGNLCERTVGYTTKWGDSVSDFNPLGNFTVDEVLEIGKMLGVPEEVINKAPNDGLSGETDEEKLGISYKDISAYIRTGEVDENVKNKIEEYYRKSTHKREAIPMYTPNVKKFA